MTVKQLFTLLVSLLLASAVHSAPEEFVAMLASFRTLEADFVQEIRSESGEIIDRQQGHLSLQRPRQLRWETDSPRQLMVSDGDTIYLYDPDLQQVIVRAWIDDPTQNPVSLFTGDMKLDDWFHIERQSEGYLLSPLQDDSLIASILVYLDEAGKPAGFRVQDRSGQVSDIRFAATRFDVTLSDAQFRFVPPADADVIFDD